jgi:hypothetical protein
MLSINRPPRAFQSRARLFYYCIAICILGMLHAGEARAQAYLETYGQNRIQYRKFNWKVFETTHFRIYHYDMAGKDLARYVAEQAENEIAAVEHRTGGKFTEQFNIIVYNSYDEYRQTNVGRKHDAQQLQSVQTGKVNMVDDKLVVYFNGVHTDLKAQLKNGIARVLMQKSMYGDNIKEMVKSAATLNVPEWLTEGYITYVAEGWDEPADKEWRGMMETYPTKGFYFFTEKKGGVLAGRAFWKYIAERYGKPEVKSLLNSVEQHKNLNKALKAKYKLNVVKVFDSCMAFYRMSHAADAATKDVPDTAKAVVKIKVPKDDAIIRDIRVSPRGGDVAYVRWKHGEFQVCLQNATDSRSVAVILEEGKKDFNEEADPGYPLLSWSNTGFKLAILYKRGPNTRLRIYDAVKGKIFNYVIPRNRFDRVLGIAFDEDNDGIVMSAIKKSQTDLYLFTIRGSKLLNITNDAWDDVQPAFVSGGRRRGIVFMSNRPKPNLNVPAAVNELPTGPMNVFFYDTKTKSTALLQCSNSAPDAKVSQPVQFGSDNFAYLYDQNGVRNKYVVVFGRNMHNLDSAYWVPATNYSTSLMTHQYNPAGNLVADVLQQDGYYNVYIKPLEIPNKDVPAKELSPALLVEKESDQIGLIPPPPAPKKVNRKDARRMGQFNNLNMGSGNAYQTEFTMDDNNHITSVPVDAVEDTSLQAEDEMIRVPAADSSFMKMKARPYRVGFKPNNFTVSLDNSLLFTKYQSAGLNGNQYSNPSLAGLVTISLDDMMENYRITGGFRLPFAGVGSTYFMQYENVRHRLDWSLTYLHTANLQNYDVTFTDSSGRPLFTTMEVGKTVTDLLQAGFSYPLDKLRSLRFQFGLRQDVLHFKSLDTFSLTMAPQRKVWTMSRMEYVYDNTRNITVNIRNGLRFKVFGEYMYQMNNQGGGLYNFGFDFRNYVKIYKNLIWAFRAAGAHSGGKQKVLYFLGGVDNWMNAQYSDLMPVAQEQYGFQALATNLRGYKQNARNGNSYTVFNSEFRFPVLTSLIQRPIQSKILRSLQVVAFGDVGLAWNGLLPDQSNINRSYVFTQPPVSVAVKVPGVSGIACGYGMGIRTIALGYSIRVDAAWNIEGIKTPIIYFSLGTDF